MSDHGYASLFYVTKRRHRLGGEIFPPPNKGAKRSHFSPQAFSTKERGQQRHDQKTDHHKNERKNTSLGKLRVDIGLVFFCV